jgi:large subunit ribosomal protein L3
MKLILGKKLGMTQVFSEKGEAIAVTLVEAGPCYVIQIKNDQKDGYNAIQMGFGQSKKIKKPLAGHLKKAKIKVNLKYLTEMRIEDKNENIFKINDQEVKSGDKIDVSAFKDNEKIQVTGRSKGKGFAGTIKRHKFHRGPETHGSDNVRRPGSIGMCSFPARVFKGKKMAGHMGNARVTVRNLKIAKIDPEKNILMIAGAVPGPNGGIVGIKA